MNDQLKKLKLDKEYVETQFFYLKECKKIKPSDPHCSQERYAKSLYDNLQKKITKFCEYVQLFRHDSGFAFDFYIGEEKQGAIRRSDDALVYEYEFVGSLKIDEGEDEAVKRSIVEWHIDHVWKIESVQQIKESSEDIDKLKQVFTDAFYDEHWNENTHGPKDLKSQRPWGKPWLWNSTWALPTSIDEAEEMAHQWWCEYADEIETAFTGKKDARKIELVDHDAAEKTITVSMLGTHYNISYFIKDGEKYLTHNDGYCAGTSDLTVDYPKNESYESDAELLFILQRL